MSFVLMGLGTAVPPHHITQADAAEQSKPLCDVGPEQERLVPVLYRRTTVRKRHIVILQSSTGDQAARQAFYTQSQSKPDRGPTTGQRMIEYERTAADLAIRAAQAAIARSGYAPREITHLVTASCSGFAAPGVDLEIIRKLDLRSDTARTNVGFMGCHGALNALRVARAYASADASSRVLVCAVEVCSLHHQYGWEPEKIVANALFSDGAAAVVGSSVTPSSWAADQWTLTANGACVIAETSDHMTWRVRDHGFEMSLSPEVPGIIEEKLRPWMERWLDSQGLTIGDVRSWVIHPGGPRVLQAAGAALDLTDEHLAASRSILADYGNMSSPTVLFILDRLRAAGGQPPCVMLGFGPGLAIEAALLEAAG